jgi:hypothetical protein
MRSRLWVCCLLLLCIETFIGCGARPETDAPSTHTEFVNLVDTMIDTTRQPSKFKACFAEGAAPRDADRLKYEKLIAMASPDALVEGDTARFNVSFQDPSGKEIANKEWTAVKVNEEWKLKSAPLP